MGIRLYSEVMKIVLKLASGVVFSQYCECRKCHGTVHSIKVNFI